MDERRRCDGSLDLKEIENQMNQLGDRGCTEEMLRSQLSELEMLQSMFSNPGELTLEDPSVLAHIDNYLTGKTSHAPSGLDFAIRLVIDSRRLDVCVSLPSEYPNMEPEIFVRGEALTREQHRYLNSDLSEYVSSLERGDACIGSAVAWLQENAVEYFDKGDASKEEDVVGKEKPKRNVFSRLWIYSHHIYSKVKRREMLVLAGEFNLTGFCLPGKPGVICIEGWEADCEEWWMKVRSMTWKKIMCKRKEEEEIGNGDVSACRRFSDFKEISFECRGNKRDYHMDFGEFYKYLSDHNCDYIFKDYFGFEGK